MTEAFYRRLLARYIDYVAWQEGTTFLRSRDTIMNWTDEEWAVLKECEAQEWE